MTPADPTPLLRQALSLHQSGQLDAAMALYRALLEQDRYHVEALHLLGVALRQRGQPAAACERIRAALALAPTHATAHCNLGAALQDLDDTAAALASYERALALRPDYPLALVNSGNALRRLGQAQAALERYRRALDIEPDYPEAWCNLGAALHAGGQYEAAAAACERAIALRPGDADAWCGHGAARQRQGRLDEADESYARALAAAPGHADTLANLSLLRLRQHAWADALELAEQAARRGPHALAALARAHALRALARHAEAVDAYRTARAAGADPELTDFFLAALGAAPVPPVPPAAYVRGLFDQYADHFDTHLGAALGYDTPRLLADALGPLAGARLDVLDAGCGTGLCAPWLRPGARRLDGVDLSPGMLDQARARGLYDRLSCADLSAFLAAAGPVYDLVVAADVLVYVGPLGPVFAAAARALRPGGRFACSVEVADGADYTLQPTGRYAHPDAAVLRAASGWTLLHRSDAVLRHDHGRPVAGRLYIFGRP